MQLLLGQTKRNSFFVPCCVQFGHFGNLGNSTTRGKMDKKIDGLHTCMI